MTYKDTLTKYMTELGEKDNTIFIGQQIKWQGNPMSSTVSNVPVDKLIEVPVMEDTQMGMSLGLAMSGKTVITFYPRWDFLICATNQLVNHVDKIGLMSNGEWKPNMIIRVGKGSDKPIDPGHQHKNNYLEQFKTMCPNIIFWEIKDSKDVDIAYTNAIQNGGIHVMAEYPELYNS
jgi:pyruvate/2-oxoglutarate/acetoin dehydrogenase E1 component